MKTEQQEYITSIDQASEKEIFIKKTGLEEISLSGHSHNRHQIIYTLSGTLHIYMGKTNYFVPEQHIAWIPEGMEHELSSNNCQISLLIFYCTLNPSRKSIIEQKFSIYSTNAVILENLRFISSEEGSIKKTEQPDLYNFALSFFKVLPLMNRGAEIPLQTLVVPDNTRLRPMLHYIIEHAQEDLTIEHVARQFGFSVRNFSRLLQGSGIRFTNYLNYQRITRAIELFADGDKTMQQIAYEVGFSTPNNFNRVFKQTMGVNPSIFRKKK